MHKPQSEAQDKTRRSWVLRLVLSYSRKGYSEEVSRRDTETFHFAAPSMFLARVWQGTSRP